MSQERKLPAIVIFTKYDKLVTKAMSAAGDAIDYMEVEEAWQYCKGEASEDVERLRSSLEGSSWQGAVDGVDQQVVQRDYPESDGSYRLRNTTTNGCFLPYRTKFFKFRRRSKIE